LLKKGDFLGKREIFEKSPNFRGRDFQKTSFSFRGKKGDFIPKITQNLPKMT